MLGTTNLLTLAYGYGTSNNNGNVESQAISFAALGGAPAFSETQNYSEYDAVNRLVTVSTGVWSETNGYDSVGNRWVALRSGLPALTQLTPQSASWFDAQNRISGWTYDGAGNLKAHLSRTFDYDAENRQTSAVVNGATATYSYDGEGRRVKAVTPAGTTVYVYDASGALAAEYSTTAPREFGVTYLTADHLGSTRLLTDGAGAVKKRYDYLPFGEELAAGVGGRTAGMGYGDSASMTVADRVTVKFTGKERDAETGLDYFGARYYSGAQGRFTSPDPAAVTKRTVANPQKSNRYAYVLNNPLAFVDPNGEEEVRVTVRAFIPDSTFRYPKGIGPTWTGDGRGFSAAANASHRAQAVLTIETDPSRSSSPLVGKPALSTSGSEVDLYGLGSFRARSDVSATVGSNFRDSNGNSIVSFSLSASDPLVPGAPPTGGTMTVTVSSDGSSVQMNGAVAVYPAWEAYAQQPATGNQGTLLQYTPAGTSANSPGALLTGATMNVRGRTTLRPPDPPKPPCTPGQPGCQ